MKKPSLYHYPLMFASALAAIVIVGWIATTVIDMKGQRDEVLHNQGLSGRP